MVVVMCVELLGGGSTCLLVLVALLLLQEVEVVIPIVLSLLTLTFPIPFFAVRPSLLSLPLPFASSFLAIWGPWGPLVGRNDSWPRHSAIRALHHPIGVDVYGGYCSRRCEIVLVGQHGVCCKVSLFTFTFTVPIALSVAFPVPLTYHIDGDRMLLWWWMLVVRM